VKDFDAQRHKREANTDGRSFTIGGERLTARASVSPDIWIDYYDRRRTNTQTALAGGESMSNREYLDFLDDHVRATLEPDSGETCAPTQTRQSLSPTSTGSSTSSGRSSRAALLPSRSHP
jgi:hypothetical protein